MKQEKNLTGQSPLEKLKEGLSKQLNEMKQAEQKRLEEQKTEEEEKYHNWLTDNDLDNTEENLKEWGELRQKEKDYYKVEKDITAEMSWNLHKDPEGGYRFHGFLNKDLMVILDCKGIRKLNFPYAKDIMLLVNKKSNTFKILKRGD